MVDIDYSGIQGVQRNFTVVSKADEGTTASSFVGTPETFGKFEGYDRFGRLQLVLEDLGVKVDHDGTPGTPDATAKRSRTLYDYAPHGEIKSVRMLEFDRNTGLQTPGTQQQTRTFTYDGRGFLVSESHPEFAGVTRTYDYDSRGNRRRSNDGRNVLTYAYDELENLDSVKIDSTAYKAYEYFYGPNAGTARGHLKAATRFTDVPAAVPSSPPPPEAPPLAEGGRVRATETLGYDSLGRVASKATEVEFADGSDEGWRFLQRYTYDNLGNAKKLSYPCLANDELTNCRSGRVEAGGEPGIAPTHRRRIDYDYRQSYLVAVEDDFGAHPYIPEIRYHPNGMFAQATLNEFQDQANPGTWVTLTYSHGQDPSGMQRPASYSVADSGGGITLLLTYDASGNVATAGPLGNEEEYFYDGSGRLIGVAAEKTTGDFAESYAYDVFGNRSEVRRGTLGGNPLPVDTVQPGVDAATNRLMGGYTFDASGNVDGRPRSSSQTISSTFDPFNLKIEESHQSRQWRYFYTADDERLGVIRPEADPDNEVTLYLRDLSGKLLSEFDLRGDFIFADGFESGDLSAWSNDCAGAGCPGSRGGTFTRLDAGWQRDYIYRGSQHQVTVANGFDGDEDGELRRSMAHDHLGTPRLTYQSEGGVTGYYVLPFGRRLPSQVLEQGQREQTLRYTSHERDLGDENDATDDLDYMHARHCSPVLGRFMGIDPINSAKPGAPQTWNRYAYVRNSPVNYVDPDGRKSTYPPEYQAAVDYGIENSARFRELMSFARNTDSVDLVIKAPTGRAARSESRG